jgi:hypothetical protein
VALAGRDLLLVLNEGLEVVLGDTIDQPFEPAAVLDPSAGSIVEGRKDVDTDSLIAGAGMEIEGRMLPALPATARD